MFLDRTDRILQLTTTVGFIAVATILPFLLPTQRLLHLGVIWLNYALLAYGLSFIYAQTGRLSIAHAALWGIGCYTSALMLRHMGLGFWESLLPAGLLGGISAAAIGYPSLRISGHYFVIATFAFGEFLVLAGNNLEGLTNGPQGLIVLNDIEGFGLIHFHSIESYYYLSLLFAVAGIAALYLCGTSRFGRQLTAIRENEQLAQSVGINLSALKIAAFTISGIYAGLAGPLYVYYQHHIEPPLFGADASLLFILMVVLGGARTLAGPLVGAALWIFLPELIGLNPVDSRLAFGVMLVLMILILPKGVFGTLLVAGRHVASQIAGLRRSAAIGGGLN